MAFPVVPATRMDLLRTVFRSIPPERESFLASRVSEILGRPLTGPLAALCSDRPAMLALLRSAEDLAREAGLGEEVEALRSSPVFGNGFRFDEGWIEDAWERVLAGSAHMLDLLPAIYDPVGQLSGGAVYFLDRRGVLEHRRSGRRSDPDLSPPVSFGLISRGGPERVRLYNEGQFGRLGDVSLDFPDELRMAVVPPEAGDDLRSRIPLQFVMPSSDILAGRVNREWARSLPDRAVVVTGIKGLSSEGRTPLEHFTHILKKAGRTDVVVIDLLGYVPSKKWLEQQRLLWGGDGRSFEPWELVLASTDAGQARKLALRWAGPTAAEREEVRDGTSVTVVENRDFTPPLRIVILTDPDLIRANELASIYKNLEAIHLGQSLFEKMHQWVREGRDWDKALESDLTAFYQEKMGEAEADIRRVISLEMRRTPREKRALLNEVRNDLFGSWGTKDFRELYRLVQIIFGREVRKREWARAMVLLKAGLPRFYSVRNPRYAFGLAADRQAALRGRWLHRDEVGEAVSSLKEEGLLPADFPGPVSKGSAHFDFSMIPDGLLPEGLYVAEQLMTRYPGRRFPGLPKTFHDSALFAVRMQRETFFAPEVQRAIVDLSQELTQPSTGSDEGDRQKFLPIWEKLPRHFESALRFLETEGRAFPHARRRLRVFLMTLTRHAGKFMEAARGNGELRRENILLLNQAILEILARSNLFYILPPDEGNEEAALLWRRLEGLERFVRGEGTMKDLFWDAEEGAAVSIPLTLPQFDDSIRQELMALTHRMNLKLHEQESAVSRRSIVMAVKEIKVAIVRAVRRAAGDRITRNFLNEVKRVSEGILRELSHEEIKLDGRARLLVFQALIEVLIHARRFLVFTPEEAAREIPATAGRFLQIRNFLKGDEESPLWRFGSVPTT